MTAETVTRQWVDPDEPWRYLAACADCPDPEAFFPDGAPPPRVQAAAVIGRYCRVCPVTEECGREREVGLNGARGGGQGVWGGRYYDTKGQPIAWPEVAQHGRASGLYAHLLAGEEPCKACLAEQVRRAGTAAWTT